MTATEIITVRDLRRRLGLSQLDLAVALHVTRPMVQRWESGKNAPTPHKLAVLAQFAVMSGLKAIVVAGPNAVVETCGCGLVHGVGVRCPACLTDYTPSVEEIAAATARVQSEWTETEKANRSRGMTGEEWEVSSIHRFGGRRLRDREDSHGGD